MPVTTVTLPIESLLIDPSAEWGVSGAANALAALQSTNDSVLLYRLSGLSYALIRGAVEAPALGERDVLRRIRVVARHSRSNTFSLSGLRVVPSGWLPQAGQRSMHDASGPWVTSWDEVGGKPLVEFGDNSAATHDATVALSRLYAEAQIISPATISLTGPAPTVDTDHPTVTWDNSGLVTADVVRIVAYDHAAHDGLDPDTTTSTPLIDTGGWGPSGSQQIGPLPSDVTVDVYAQVVETHSGIQYAGAWDHREVVVRAAVPAAPQVSGQWIHHDQSVQLTVVSRRNLLPANVANATDPGGALTGFTAVGGSVLSSSTAQAWIGGRSLRAARDGSAGTLGVVTPGGTSGTPVVAGKSYTALVYVRPSAAQTWQVRVNWFDAAGDPCTPPNDASSPSSIAAGGWTQISVTATAPDDAAFASVQAWAEGVADGQSAHLDAFALHRGTQPLWGIPGVPEEWQSLYVRGLHGFRAEVRNVDECVMVDRFVPRGDSAVYESRGSFPFVASGAWVPAATLVPISDGQWWLKHPTDAGLDTPIRARTVWSQSRTEHGDVHQPLDSDVSIKVSGDTYGDDGTLQFFEVGPDHEALHAVLSEPGPLLLQDCYGGQQWITWTPGAWRWDLDGPPATARYKTSRDYVAVAAPPVT